MLVLLLLRLITVGGEVGLLVLLLLLVLRLAVGSVAARQWLDLVLLRELEVLLLLLLLEWLSLILKLILVLLLLLLLSIGVLGIVVARRPVARGHGSAIVHTSHDARGPVVVRRLGGLGAVVMGGVACEKSSGAVWASWCATQAAVLVARRCEKTVDNG